MKTMKDLKDVKASAKVSTRINDDLRVIASKRKENPDETFFLSDELIAKIDGDAQIEGRSVTGQVRAILETLYGLGNPGVGKNVRELFFRRGGTVINGRYLSVSELADNPQLWTEAQNTPVRAEMTPPSKGAAKAA